MNAPQNPHPLVDFFHRHPWIAACNPLYVLSAACMLAGAYQVLVPLYDDPSLAMEKFACVLTLNLYEIALLAVAITIVTWRRAFDDAVAVTVILAIFLVVTPITLDTVAPDFPGPTLLLGFAGLLLAVPKLYGLQRYVIGRDDALRIAGVTVLMVWNLLMPAILGFRNDGRVADDIREVWWAGWWMTLLGGAVLWLDARSRADTVGLRLERGEPFLRTVGMRWLVAAIVLAATFAHQFALNWAFGLNVTLADFTPALALACMIAIEIRRSCTRMPGTWDYVVLALPMVGIVTALTSAQYLARPLDPLSLASYPPYVALLTAAVLIAARRRWRWRHIRWFGAPYALLGLVALGTVPERPFPVVEYVLRRPGWALVALGFVILAGGAVFTLWRHRPGEPPEIRLDFVEPPDIPRRLFAWRAARQSLR